MSCNRMCFTNDGMQMDLECASCPGRDGYVPTEVKKMKNGDELRDNDPRMYSGNRVLEIIGIDKTHVIARQGNLHPVRIRIDRIYPEGKQRRTGFTLIRKIRESMEIGIGDIVTRDGTDWHLVYGVNASGDLISVICIKEPNKRDSDDSPWIKLGETEHNLVGRYSLLKKANYDTI